jgi:uncharacterized protein YlxW (UPF0749 family)
MSTDTGIDADLAEFAEAAKELQKALHQHSVRSTASNAVTIGAGSGVAIIVSLVAIVVLCVAGAIVFSVKAQRDADIRALTAERAADMRDIEAANREITALRSEISGMREKVDIGSAYDATYQRRLSALEAKVGK